MDNLLIHRCTIKTKTKTGTDAFGEPTYSWGDKENVVCRFVNPKGSELRLPSGEFVTKIPKIVLKSNETIAEQNKITGTSGFSGTYNVLKVYPRYDSNGLHHYACDLEVIAE